MIRINFALILLLFPVATSGTAAPQDNIFGSTVRESDPLTATDELQKLKVPHGFQVTLFASEPQLQKPLNMAFDADGRLWVTGSNEYPFPAKDGEGKDSIRILEDTNGDGAADKVTVFADDLNIPIGIYPYRDGAIVFSIPDILFLRDTDGDGRADKREVLYGPFDTSRDTHGMNNSFRRGFDGWLYCCHGFNNQSTVAGKDGHKVTLVSGNTYRIRLDGSRIEQFTYGQVNPFGMAIDANGDLFNSDCHTKPVTLLMRNGYYESFGKPDDGLGFVPAVMDHLHGSTAIDGLCQYQGTTFPDEYSDDIFVGNVMTCRVHRNSIVRTGSSVRMQEEADFLTSEDPWFRPVDIQIGPDGAMYIADFYNRVIGHYEVPLDHPGRDRERGRIWKVQYSASNAADGEVTPRLSSASLPELTKSLSDARRPVRQHAADQIVDRIGSEAAQPLTTELANSLKDSLQPATPQILWSLFKLGQLQSTDLRKCYLNGTERSRIHVLRICSEMPPGPDVTLLIRSGLLDPSALVKRAAADAAAQHPDVEILKEVINLATTVSSDDVHLQHGLKIALRNQLLDPEVADWFKSQQQPVASATAVAGILDGLHCDHTGAVALSLLTGNSLEKDVKSEVFRRAARSVSQDTITVLTSLVRQLPSPDAALKIELWTSLSDTIAEKSLTPPSTFVDWSVELGENIFESFDLEEIQWGQYRLQQQPSVKWGVEPRLASATASKMTPFISSLPGGERGVGVLRSRPFVAPFSMSLEVCGHLGPPTDPAVPDNRIVLRDYATGAELKSALPPRNDVATKVTWNLIDSIGTKVYLEVVDGIDLTSYAWISLGRIQPKVIDTRELSTSQSTVLESVLKFLQAQQRAGNALTETDVKRLGGIVAAQQVDGNVRAFAAGVLLVHRSQPFMQGVADLLVSAETPRSLQLAIVDYCDPQSLPNSGATAVEDASAEFALLRAAFTVINQPLRVQLVRALSQDKASAELLLQCIDTGVPSAEALRDDRIAQQISAYGETFAARVSAQKAELPSAIEDTTALTASIVRRLKLSEGDTDAGKAVFTKHCANCHRRGTEGKLVGPQLDGIGTRGAPRLLEDILHPNQNVDLAFRTSVLVLNDGRIVSGLVRETRDPQLLEVIDTTGNLITVKKQDVEERKDSTISMMPGNVSKLLTEDNLLNLIRWLLK